MCGIAGYFTSLPTSMPQPDFGAMLQALQHRGPDGSGVWHCKSKMASLLHVRLAIIDPSLAGKQPMHTVDGRFTIVFNGEIYNYLELRSKLESQGLTFISSSDTEVLLQWLVHYGPSSITHLRGMFTFALWDSLEQTCLLGRDRFGIKPLYYFEYASTLLIASEIRTILASGLVNGNIEANVLAGFFQTGTVPDPAALVHDVKMLPAGCTLSWKNGVSKIACDTSVTFPCPNAEISWSQAVKITREALLDSVEKHFVSDVPVGIFLSGGIDSTAILALSQIIGKKGIKTFSLGVDDTDLDETDIARRTAQHFGTDHVEWRLDGTEARKLFDEFLSCIDQPTIDGFNTYVVSRLARQNGYKVVLSGLGGDELFAGYRSFTTLPKLQMLVRLPLLLRQPLAFLLGGLASKPNLQRLASALMRQADLDELYDVFRGIFSAEDAAKLVRHYLSVIPTTIKFSHLSQQPTMADSISVMELSRYMRNQLLRDGDVMSMANGVELRVPLVDTVFFDRVATIPAKFRLKLGKKLLLAAVPEIPSWVTRQKKRGFFFPYEKWLETPEWAELFTLASKDIPVPLPNWYQRWSLLVFDQWRKRNYLIEENHLAVA